MKVVRSKGRTFWHVVHNDVVIDGFYTKREAQAFVDENKDLCAILDKL